MEIKFTIYGEPKAKARPRMTRTGHTYTPKETVEYETYVRMSYLENHVGTQLQGEIVAEIKSYFTMPKSASKTKTQDMRIGNIRPVKKPDCDNLAKIVLDALNGVAYHDDSQIVCLLVNKFYSDNPRVEVILRGD